MRLNILFEVDVKNTVSRIHLATYCRCTRAVNDVAGHHLSATAPDSEWLLVTDHFPLGRVATLRFQGDRYIQWCSLTTALLACSHSWVNLMLLFPSVIRFSAAIKTYKPIRLGQRLQYASTEARRNHDPLRILFCGSDEISAASLRTLHEAALERPDFIASIEVVCKMGKPVGRGMKHIREGNSRMPNPGLSLKVEL